MSTDSTKNDAATTPVVSDSVPAPVRALLSMFEGALSGVSFPGIDGSSLVTSAERMDEISKRLAEAAAEVETLRQELTSERESLLRDSKKALEYARVFASDQPELKAEVEAIDLDSLLEGPKKKRTRKSSKKKSAVAASKAEPDPQVEVADPASSEASA